ncbi:MAG: FG-GAP-like repeat-containing protein, partial [Cyclobacteriaceae bacterium]
MLYNLRAASFIAKIYFSFLLLFQFSLFSQDIEFDGVVTHKVGSLPYYSVLEDFNEDGELDIAVANTNSSNISILLGNGSGGFDPSNNYQVEGGPAGISLQDFNNDNKWDLVCANAFSASISILFGNGDGSFSSATNYSVGLTPFDVKVLKVNSDEYWDLVVSNSSANSLSILLGNSDGTFNSAAFYEVGNSPNDMSLFDLDGNEYLDLAVPLLSDNQVKIIKNDGSGNFVQHSTYDVGVKPGSVFSEDFNNDDLPDLLVTHLESTFISILLNNGEGEFVKTDINTEQKSRHANFTQLNDDENIDFILTTSNGLSNHRIEFYFGDGEGDFTWQFNLESGSPLSTQLGNFDGDDMLDLILVNNNENDISFHKGLSNNNFKTTPVFGGETFNSNDLISEDFNLDGFADLVISHSTGLGVSYGDGNGNFSDVTNYDVNGRKTDIGLLNGDEFVDIALANQGADAVTILLGSSSGEFNNIVNYPVGDGPWDVAIGKINQDDFNDIVTANLSSDDVTVYYGTSEGTFANKIDFDVGDQPIAVSLGDLNGDNRLDIVTANLGSNSISILYADTDGSFEEKIDLGVGVKPNDIQIYNFNDDSFQDIIVTHSNSDFISILYGNLDGDFDASNTLIGDGQSDLHIADLNNDGFNDLTLLSEGRAKILQNNNGIFDLNSSPYAMGQTAKNIVLSDFNEDDKIDIVGINSRGGASFSRLLNITNLDSDNDGVNDEDDLCPGFDDSINNDGDAYPQGCDCDDEDADVFPGAPAKADGKDNDCDGNIDKGDQTITFDLAATATFGAEPIALTASSTSELTVSLTVTSGPGTLSEGNLTITGAGTIVVTASQAGDDLWNAAENVVRELVVAKASQTITFELQATATFGSDPITLSATSSVSTLAVEYTVDGPGKIEEGKLVITGAGTITVTASQPGNDNYSAAESVVRTVTVPKVEQTLTFELISEAMFGAAPIPLTATSSQDTIKVILTVAGPATITDGVLTITGAGTITVTASHPGNDIIAAAESIVRTLVVAKASQSITFAAINDVIFGDAVISLSATSTSELAIEYAVTGPAELAGGNLTFTGPGTVTVTASQGGDDNYAAAESVTNTFCVNPEMPTITNTNNVLSTGVTGTHTWFKDGNLIDGEVSNSLAVTESGTYSVTVTIGGCTSQSAEADAVVTGLFDDLKTSLKVFPNPTVSYLKLELHNTQQQPFNVALIDLAGHIVDVKMVNSLGSYEEVV